MNDTLRKKEKMMKRRKKSLKVRLLGAFCLTSIIPIVLVNLFAYFNTSNIVRDSVQELSYSNLLQTKSSLDVWLKSYEDILFQIYTDDDIVAMLDKINRGEDVSVSKNQLRRTLHGLFYTKEYIQCISVLTENGTLVFYDLLTGSSTKNSWLDDMDMSREELYDEISADNTTHIFPTQKTKDFGTEDHYLFHIGHRIIDYRDVDKRLGIVVVSINEDFLSYATQEEQVIFMMTQMGYISADKEIAANQFADEEDVIYKKFEGDAGYEDTVLRISGGLPGMAG